MSENKLGAGSPFGAHSHSGEKPEDKVRADEARGIESSILDTRPTSAVSARLREQLVLAVSGNPISADDAWAILHAWDRFTDPEWWLAELGRQQGRAE